MKKIICVFSGGLDSTVLLYKLFDEGYDVTAVSFNYGQRHTKELEYAAKTCRILDVKHKIIDISSIVDIFAGSALTDDVDVPAGHYEEESMKVTVVPNRNSIFLNLALAYALSQDYTKVFYGAHAGDHFIYNDCREPFQTIMNDLFYIWSDDNRGSLSPEWVKAFFEAEGCFTHTSYKQIMYHRKTRKRIGTCRNVTKPVCVFTQKDKPLLEEIKKFFYGYGSIQKSGSNGVYEYRMSGQTCRLMVDLFKNGFKTHHKAAQFKRWYTEFKPYLTGKIQYDSKQYTDRKYYIQDIELNNPFNQWSKSDIVKEGAQLEVPFVNTWSCYKGGDIHCGVCGTCTERKEAFKLAGIKDPTEYEE